MNQKPKQNENHTTKNRQLNEQTVTGAINDTYNYQYFTNMVDGFDEESTLFTHMQVHDSYREGTIDNHIENSKNNVESIPQTGYKM